MSERAQKWKRQVYQAVKFPSGNEADLIKPRMTTLITKDGNIPNKFFGVLFDGNSKQKQQQFEKMSAEEKAEYIKTMMYLADQMARFAFVSPKIVSVGEANYEADQIHLEDLEDEDKQFLLNWVMDGGEPDEALKRFLEQQQSANLVTTPKK